MILGEIKIFHHRCYVGHLQRYFLVQLVNFGIIFFVIRTWVVIPIIGLLERRRETIAQGLEDGLNYSAFNSVRDQLTENYTLRLGEIDPVTAANLADAMDIKIYTIGAGKPGNAMYPYQDPIFGKRYVYQPTNIDEKTLKEIASRTDGKYFRARSGEELEEIYGIIDDLEKTEVKVAAHIQYTELFHYFAYLGLILLMLEVLLANTYFKKLP